MYNSEDNYAIATVLFKLNPIYFAFVTISDYVIKITRLWHQMKGAIRS